MFTFAWHALAMGHASGRFPQPNEARVDRRLAALPALSDQGRPAGRVRRAGGSSSGRRSRPRSGSTRRLADDSARSEATKAAVAAIIAARRRGALAAGLRRSRLLRHDRRLAGGGDCAIRISSRAVCSPTGRGGHPARRCPRCRCRSIRNSARGPKPNRARPRRSSAATKSPLKRLAAHQARLRAAARRPRASPRAAAARSGR